MKFPDFIIIGGARCATTSLYYYLNAHPKIQMSKAVEPNFFVNINCLGLSSFNPLTYVSDLDEYANQWTISDQILGEKSPLYLYCKDSPQLIYSHNRDVKLLVILRNPMERAYSHYLFHKRKGNENLEFWEAVEKIDERKKEGYHWAYDYIGAGYYYSQLKRYYSYFHKNQILIMNYDNLQTNPTYVYEQILEFLKIDYQYYPRFDVYNKSDNYDTFFSYWFHPGSYFASLGKKLKLRKILPRVFYNYLNLKRMKGKSSVDSQCPRDTYFKLCKQYYKNEIINLQQLTGLDFSTWLC